MKIMCAQRNDDGNGDGFIINQEFQIRDGKKRSFFSLQSKPNPPIARWSFKVPVYGIMNNNQYCEHLLNSCGSLHFATEH